MAKRRKISSRRDDESRGPDMDVGESRKRIRDFEDVADSDDEFHLNRDKVLLEEEPKAKRRRKAQEHEEFLEPSDEEVLDYYEDEEDGDNVEPSALNFAQEGVDSASDGLGHGAEDEEEDAGWGMSKDEIYGADEVETEEQALEEEAEALRLQQKHLQSMTAADYGFDEAEWQTGAIDHGEAAQDGEDVVTETLPQMQIREDMSQAERVKLLKSRYPEFDLLSKELLKLREVQARLAEYARPQNQSSIASDLPNATTKLRVASAYLGALTMYFTLLSSPAASGGSDALALPAARLRDHPVMDSLVKCRELWLRAKDLPADAQPLATAQSDKLTHMNGLTNGLAESVGADRVNVPRQKKSRAQRHAEAAEIAAEARRAERLRRTEAGLADLGALIEPVKSKKLPRLAKSTADIDSGEEAPMTALEAAEKAKRKKSLRFYTSQIAQKSNKRGTAGRNAGGDDDIPYRERLKDRQARLNAEAERRGRSKIDAGAELGGESDEEDRREAQAVRAGGKDDYYDLVAARTTKKKADKAAFAEAQKLAALQGGRVVQEEDLGPDGKRKISYLIEKNKGLTPHRKKEVRNPRVKKRKKYDEKKKKLGSIKPVYKGGEGRGGYGGELTGIKKGLIKSTKL